MVMDELDAAAAKMPARAKSTATETEKNSTVVSAHGAPPKENPLVAQSKRWWKRATSLAPSGLKASIVSCRLQGGTQFMSKSNCLSRGGEPKSVSG